MLSKATLTATEEGFDFWTSRPYQSPAFQGQIRSAAILLVPREKLRSEHEGPLFPSGTTEFFQFLHERVPAGLTIDLAVEDEIYNEVAFHDGHAWLVDILVRNAALPVVIGLTLEWLKRRKRKNKADSRISFRVTVEEERAGRKVRAQITYDGSAADLKPEVLRVAQGAFDGGASSTGEAEETKRLPPQSPKE